MSSSSNTKVAGARPGVGTEPVPAAQGSRPAVPSLPELLAPAGDWECAKAAIENGADAIYFGLEKFNARMRAHNFTEADLPKLMEFLHRRGVKGYVTFNTLVFENELPQAEQYARTIIAAGVDAAIVQDVGICRLIRRLSADFPIHVSTQMTVTSPAGVDFARELGCSLVVLARECSLKEIEQIAKGVGRGEDGPSSAPPPLPVEVFVHGALCVAYSGQCLTSEALGGRSANRGECAQACRMPYDLLSDGKVVPLGDRKYLLSPQDLAGLELLPELVRGGVASLKIEGRLKTPEYVASITRIYRQALDRLVPEPASPEPQASADSQLSYEMQMAFSRGLYSGWFRGTNNQALVHGRFGKKRGVYLGEVCEMRRDGIVIGLEGPLKPGDGIVFDAGRPEEKEEGGRVYEVGPLHPFTSTPLPRTGVPPVSASPGVPVFLSFGRGDINFARVHVGDKLWKTSDPELERRLRQSFEGERPRFQRPISLEVHGTIGIPLTVIARDEAGHVVRVDSSGPIEKADRQPLTEERLWEQLGRLGGTPFRLGQLTNLVRGDALIPLSELNRLRREIVAQLDSARAKPRRWSLQPAPATEVTAVESGSGASSRGDGLAPRLKVLVRNLAQVEATLGSDVQTLYCDFEDPRKYREAVRLARSFRPAPASQATDSRLEVFAAPPRVFKMGEEWTLKQVRSSEADGYLIRNYDHLAYFANERRVGDYSLNVANHLTAEYFMGRFGLERITASYDLNFTQLEALLKSAPPAWFEVTVHQHIPMFHMEHCIFCAFLCAGTDYTNCGRPCDRHDLKLRDRVGAEHPVKADAGCRNTVFNSRAQTGAEYAARMIALGARDFRIEFLNETPAEVSETISRYGQLLRGQLSGAELWRELKLLNQLGVTRGQMAG